MASSIPIAVRGSSGVRVVQGPPSYGDFQGFKPVETKSCRVISFSHNGNYLAYVHANVLKIVRTDNWTDVATVEGTKAYFLSFSPKDTFLATWEPYEITKANPNGSPNLHIYTTCDGKEFKSFVHKPQSNWEPHWSNDEKLFSKMQNNDVVFFEDTELSNTSARLKSCKVASYSVSPMVGTYYVICHNPGAVGQPSLARLFKYPNLETNQAVANKSFFQADKVEYYWNAKGTHALLLTTTEQDKTGKTYYGKQTLHYFSVNGQTNMVSVSKEGPIYSVAWSPKGQEFCVIYGLMPSKATIYNLKCDVAFELGTGPKNAIYYNPFGNILIIGGFGNLRGNLELWDVNARKLISKCDAADTTLLEWAPDGVHFMTATTAPRLRIGNGYKIWHYSGTLVHESLTPSGEELYDVMWKKYPLDAFKEPVISNEKVQGIVSKEIKASTQAYRPPSARNKPTVAFKLHDDDEPAGKAGVDAAVSKKVLQMRKKRAAKKAKKEEEDKTGTGGAVGGGNVKASVKSNVQVTLTGDVEVDKKIKNIKKKLDDIAKLKHEQTEGKILEVNQMTKIASEQDLIKELRQMCVINVANADGNDDAEDDN